MTFLRTTIRGSALVAIAMLSARALAADVPMHIVDEKGIAAAIGTIRFEPTAHGVLFTPALKGLPAGVHGFHVHENPSCEPREQGGKPVPALAAGGHFDPARTGRHEGPWGQGHLGDLPALFVDASGQASYPVLAPRLRMADLKGRSLMIHMGADNHADHPVALGGGGARIACGVIEP